MSFIGVIQWDALCSPYGSFIECRWEEPSHFSFWPTIQFQRLSCHYADRPKDEISFCRVHFRQIFKKAALNRHRTIITDANRDNEMKETQKKIDHNKTFLWMLDNVDRLDLQVFFLPSSLVAQPKYDITSQVESKQTNSMMMMIEWKKFIMRREKRRRKAKKSSRIESDRF